MEKRRNLRLKLKDIIEELDFDGLKAFILQYASNDKSFEIALKSHFISRINTGLEESEKYKRILEELVKPKNAHNKITQVQKKVLNIVFKDFVLQMNDCLSMDNYMEAYFLIKECLDKIAYLQNRYGLKDQTIELCRIQILGGLDIILDKELAPAFRSRIESELKEIAMKSYYLPQDQNLIELLNQKNVLVREEKSDFIDELLSKSKNRIDTGILIKTLIQLSYPFPELSKQILMSFSHDKVFEAILSLIREGKFDFVDFYISNEEVEFKHNREALNIFKHIEKEDHKELNRSLNALLESELSILDLRKIIDALPEDYLRKEVDKIQTWVESLPFSLMSSIFAKANKNKELLTILKKKNDVEWLKVYDKLLIDRNYKKEVKALYFHIAEKYLSDHIGRKSKEYLDKIQTHLYKIGETRIFEDLYHKLSEKFDHRISLN